MPPLSRSAAHLLLLLVAVVWGFGFVAQRNASAHLGPCAVMALRTAIALLVLAPFVRPWKVPVLTRPAVILGGLLFLAAVTQQIGIESTSAANAGFITGLYIAIVPLLSSVIYREPISRNARVGIIVSLIGLYLLACTEGLSVNAGDLWVLVCAVLFAAHVLAAAKIGRDQSALSLAYGQYVFVALLSAVPAVLFEETSVESVIRSGWDIAYLGVISMAFGYTAQVVGQRYTTATIAGVILSLESVFAALGGFLILQESWTVRSFTGCLLMLTGAVIAQLPSTVKKTSARNT